MVITRQRPAVIDQILVDNREFFSHINCIILIVLSGLDRGVGYNRRRRCGPWKGGEGVEHSFSAFVGYASCWRTCWFVSL